MEPTIGTKASNQTDQTPNGFAPVKATEDQLRAALQALYDLHACGAVCRTCDYAWNLLNDEPDNGEGASGEKPECHIDDCDLRSAEGHFLDLAADEQVLSRGYVLHKTAPHGEHAIILVEDNDEPGQRLYDIVSGRKPGIVGFTGEEVDDVAHFWATEKMRPLGQTMPPQ